jgi:hypothetical protein
MSHQLPPEPLNDEAVRKAESQAFEILMQASQEFAKMPYSEQRLCGGRSHHPNEIRDMLVPQDPRTIANAPPITQAQSAWFDNLLGAMFSK